MKGEHAARRCAERPLRQAALFDEIVPQAIELREDLAMADEAPGAIFRQRVLTALNEPTWVRFVTWEALDYPRSRRIALLP